MARQDGNHPFVGRIGDLIYYKRNGKYFVRKAGNPSKEKIKNAPEFEKTRKLNNEFSACVKVGHDLREAIASLLPDHSDKDITGRLVGLFSKVIKKGRGECGSRMIEIIKNKELIKGFDFNKSFSFDKVFNEYIHFSSLAKRKEVSMKVEAFNPQLSLGKYSGVTHFRLFIGVVAFSDFKYDDESKSYKPVHPSVHESFKVSFSDFISVYKKNDGIILRARLPVKDSLPKSVGVISIIGIEFCKEENEIMYALPGKNCMKVGEVF